MIHVMDEGEELVDVHATLQHQPAQGRAVVAVETSLQALRLSLAYIEQAAEIGADAPVHLAEEVDLARIERVVEVEDPGFDVAEGGEVARLMRSNFFYAEHCHSSDIGERAGIWKAAIEAFVPVVYS